MTQKVFYAMYDDDHKLLDAAKKVVSEGVKVKEVFSPFPVHGIDPVIGIRPTRLGDMAFIYGLIGLTLALIGMRYFMIVDWPMNIGGKPNFSLLENLPSFVPIAFEFTVLCTAHGMALTYFFRNKTLPGMPASNPDPRTTDDKFVMEISTEDNSMSADDISALLKGTDIDELEEKSFTVEEEDRF